ncbi:B12-binding domain-containing radical SAM protein, partial [Candidatus Desantisbacteria bacterium]|nr:B12-binding domain-containing radical SAM protein [Candidatus Desantisbacteria bacterium]
MEFRKIIQDQILSVERPAQYINKEWNSLHTNSISPKLKIALAFPDMYEIGMSNLGQRILYHVLNNLHDVSAERVYAPAPDMEAILRSQKIPLLSLESGTPLYKFDIIGFTLQNETSYTNVLNMLDLGNIPILSCEREKKHPLIIAGGPCVFNPEPMADFFDAFVIGDGEDVVIEIAETCKNWRDKFADRQEVLRALAKIKGIYIPDFYDIKYNGDGSFCNFLPKNNLIPSIIDKRIFAYLDREFYPDRYIVPYISIVHDRAILEISRGCSRGCRLCQAGIIYRPVR